MSFKKAIFQELKPYLEQIEAKIESALSSFGPATPLSEAIAYSLKNGGKRFRPALVLILAKALGKEDVLEPALAVEYFHTASLIADDLPCMDNDALRREKPSVHTVYGEATALLASYALISEGYDKIRLGAKRRPEALALALEQAALNTGIYGATGGQYLDLFAPTVDEQVLKEVILKKTATLFELSFALGWLFGGGDLAKLPLVRKGAVHFGTAFQIVDDFHDEEKDKEEKRPINAPLLLGRKVARAWLQEELSSFQAIMQELSLDSKELKAMSHTLAASSS